jgi:hypothetical protein
MLHCHVSQFYEWLPYNKGCLAEVPAQENARREWLANLVGTRLRAQADRYRSLLVSSYGPEHGSTILYAEAFEASEYGAPLHERAQHRLFPFVTRV